MSHNEAYFKAPSNDARLNVLLRKAMNISRMGFGLFQKAESLKKAKVATKNTQKSQN